jgi:hypothetical protein
MRGSANGARLTAATSGYPEDHRTALRRFAIRAIHGGLESAARVWVPYVFGLLRSSAARRHAGLWNHRPSATTGHDLNRIVHHDGREKRSHMVTSARLGEGILCAERRARQARPHAYAPDSTACHCRRPLLEGLLGSGTKLSTTAPGSPRDRKERTSDGLSQIRGAGDPPVPCLVPIVRSTIFT